MNAASTLTAPTTFADAKAIAQSLPALRPAARRTSLRSAIAHRWDLFGVLALMGSSAAYAVYTLLHLA